MKEKKIKVLKIEPGKKPYMCTLVNKLSELQKAVSIGADYVGLIEIVNLEKDVCLLCNEEGKLIGLEPNRRLGDDIICGVFYLIGQNDDGELTSLSKTAIDTYTAYFSTIEIIDMDEVSDTIKCNFRII